VAFMITNKKAKLKDNKTLGQRNTFTYMGHNILYQGEKDID